MLAKGVSRIVAILREIPIREDTFIRVCPGRQGDIEIRVWLKRDGMFVSTRAGLYVPVEKAKECINAISELMSEIIEHRKTRNNNGDSRSV